MASLASRAQEGRLEKLRKANDQLKREASVSRIAVSEVAAHIIKFCTDTKDPLLPSVWGKLDSWENNYKEQSSGCTLL